MGLEAEVVARLEGDTITVEVRGVAEEVAGLVIGRKGATLDALQYLAGKVLGRIGAPGIRVVVDAEGYRGRRAAALAVQARQMAQKVLETGEAASTEPLPAHERRIIHLTCAEIAGVTTRSEGDGDLKRLIVLPGGAGAGGGGEGDEAGLQRGRDDGGGSAPGGEGR
ncbi:MAG TPA: R3H domain-containing nucleic acid-binding protein [Myxococcota bacterium]|jgi:spoIIIJ-associated protein|nr:R3H domain-containing nucleic acid-binding protein [Myxococcota bacterium]